MPNELNIRATTPAPGASGAAPVETQTLAAPAAATPAARSAPYTNPALRLDPALGLVVIEFHDDSGRLSSSIPSQRQLQAYHMHTQSPPGQTSHAPLPAAVPPVEKT